jgi:hypothetical protein
MRIKNLIPSKFSTKLAMFVCQCLIGLAAVVTLTQATLAQQTITSTTQLKFACETSPNNVVTLTNNTQISSGPQAPLTETVNSKCTIVLNPQITFEASQVSMTFAGPLTIQSGNEGRALFLESHFIAPSVNVSLANQGGLLVDHSLLRATVGSIAISSGIENGVDIRGTIPGGNLVANRSISIGGGLKFIGSLTDAEVRAGTAISVNMSGAEAQFIATNSTMGTNGGAISILGSGEKSFVEFKLGAVATGRNGVNVTLNGLESTINASQFSFNSPAAGVFLRAGGSKGAVTLADGTITSGTVTTIQSSLTGVEGKAILQNATVNAGGNFRVETGSLGTSEVVDSSLTSATLVRIVAGAGGSCKSQNNIINAPNVQACQ